MVEKANPAISVANEISPAPVTAPPSPQSPPRSPPKHAEHPPARLQEELTANLASLLQQQIASRPDSAGSSDLPLQKRKNRPLGRSLSGINNRSASASMHSDIGSGSPALPSEVPESDESQFVATETVLPPSTQLGYETADAEAHRSLMEKRMKVKLLDEGGGRRVASVGTVKDSGEGDAGVGGRVRGRLRTKT